MTKKRDGQSWTQGRIQDAQDFWLDFLFLGEHFEKYIIKGHITCHGSHSEKGGRNNCVKIAINACTKRMRQEAEAKAEVEAALNQDNDNKNAMEIDDNDDNAECGAACCPWPLPPPLPPPSS